MAGDFGNYLCELRKSKGLTQKQLGDAIHVSDKTISKWENNISVPSLEMITLLSKELDINISDLISQGTTSSISDSALELLNKISKQNELDRKSSNKKFIIAVLAFTLAFALLTFYFITTREKDNQVSTTNLNQFLPMGIKMYQYPVNVPKDSKKIIVKAVNLSEDKVEISTVSDLIFDENQPGNKNTNYIITLVVDESTNLWSVIIVDSNKTEIALNHYEAKFDTSSKIGGRYISPSPPNWNPYDNKVIDLKFNTPIVLYSEAILDKKGFPVYVNNESDIKSKLMDKSIGLQNIAFLRLVVE